MDALIGSIRVQFDSGTMSDSLAEVVHDKKIWVSYLHVCAIMGKGQTTNDTVEHTNLRKYYPGAEEGRSRPAVPSLPFSLVAAEPPVPVVADKGDGGHSPAKISTRLSRHA